MKRRAILFALVLFLLFPTSVAAAECQFVLGFKTLRDLIPDIVGECLENERHGDNGDGLQQTAGGLLVWRKADNWTAFTDGYRSWINGPNGLEQRLNTEFLSWEAENAIAALPWVSGGVTGYYEDMTVRNLERLQQASPQVFWELIHKPWIQSENLYVNGAFLPFFYRQVLALTNRDEAMALRVMRMPFMVDLEGRAEAAWEVLNELYVSDLTGLQDLLAHPELRDGITNEKIALMPLLYLDLREPKSAAAIRALPWIHKYPGEVADLQRLALESQPVFWAWMEHHAREPLFGGAVERIAFMARIDEASALQIVRMPFLRTRGAGADNQVIHELWELARTRPDSFRQILSHPKLQGGITDDHAGTLYLIILGIRNPQAAAMIEALPWVQDGLGRPVNLTLNLVTLHPSEFEEGVIHRLFKLAGSSQELLTALVSKPWLQDGLDYWEFKAIQTLVDLVGYSSQEKATARSIFAMPFLETIEKEDYEVLELLYTLFDDEAGVHYILSHPKLAGGIRDGQRATVSLLRLEWEKPETAKVIWALPWVADGISAFETDAVLALYELAQNSTQSFQVLAAKNWMQDNLSADEVSVIEELSRIADRHNAQRDEAAAQRIAAMSFLESVDSADAAAVDSLSQLHWEGTTDHGYLRQALSHPALRDGITDDQAVLVSILGTVGSIAPELLDTMLDPGQVIVEQRTLTFPKFGKVDLAVISLSSKASGNMDWLEHAVRTHVQFMGMAFPKSYVALWVHDRGSGGGGPGGILHAGDFGSPNIVAHEAAHTYWAVSSPWITEGAAMLMEKISENARIGSPVEPVRSQDYLVVCAADTLAELDQRAHEGDQGICPYVLGSGLFVDLYHSLGDEAFRQSFRRLYLKMHARVHEFKCKGLERGVCYVKAAFVTDAAPQAAAIASPIINRWYYGSAGGNPQ